MERWTRARKAPLLTAAPSVLRTLLDNSSTSVYRPIGALVCKLKKGQVAQLSNMAPFLFVVTVLVALSEAEPMASTQLWRHHRKNIRCFQSSGAAYEGHRPWRLLSDIYGTFRCPVGPAPAQDNGEE